MNHLTEFATLIREDSPSGDEARAILGLRWSAGPSPETPARRLVSNYLPTTKAKWSALRRTETKR